MTLFDQGAEAMTPAKAHQSQGASRGDPRFLRRSQLSQFMDRINPAGRIDPQAPLVGARAGRVVPRSRGLRGPRRSSVALRPLLPGGNAEGPNIGLIASLATFRAINDFGFLETPLSQSRKRFV
jgi:DNA-directed RNA polymerase beta subunit